MALHVKPLTHPWRGVTDHSPKCKRLNKKLLEVKIEEHLDDLLRRQRFLRKGLGKHESQKEKNNKLGFTQNKIRSLSKCTFKKIKKQAIDWKKILQNISHKGLASGPSY